MGKIKSKLMRRTVDGLKKKGIKFSTEFEDNKKILGNTLPSKKLRNRIAGLASRAEKQKD
ncbi:30S ribosomal protein S17e [Patescibacteria group bacterium]|nr:30S ribosomal protein S17e [Patescibacteria group bacterium]